MSYRPLEFPPRLYTSEGKFAGSYVYFLCCQADVPDIVYIKIGMTDLPTKRLFHLVNNCALRPLTFGTCNVRSRRIAHKIEAQMHRVFRKWRTNGEWFRFKKEEKALFASVRDEILKPFRSSMWPMEISMHGVMPIIKDGHRRSMLYTRVLRTREKREVSSNELKLLQLTKQA